MTPQESSQTKQDPIRLHSGAGDVLVTPENEDRFVMAARRAVSACQSASVCDRFAKQFREEVFDRLLGWCREHGDRVRQCYLPSTDHGDCIKIFVVTKNQRFDFCALSDLVVDLEMEFLQAGWPCDIIQIPAGPPKELRAFFDPDKSFELFGDGNS